MRGEPTRGKQILIMAGGAIGFGAVGWLVLGPLWTIAGAAAGAVIAWIGTVIVWALASRDPAILLNQDKPDEALARLRSQIPEIRTLARIWPSQFRDVLASRLILQSDALHAHRLNTAALRSAEEAVGIYQNLAAARPGKYGPDLADALDSQSRLLAAEGCQAEAVAAIETAARLYRNLAAADPGKYLPVLAEALTCQAGWLDDIDDSLALAAASEATSIYWHKLPWPEIPSCAALAALLEGQLLCRQARYHEAARMLARGWHVAASQDQRDALGDATPALQAAYAANPDDFAHVWHAETGAEPPNWLGH